MNLEEEEVLTLASVGGGSDMKQTIDILKKSLILRNKYDFQDIMFFSFNIFGSFEVHQQQIVEHFTCGWLLCFACLLFKSNDESEPCWSKD